MKKKIPQKALRPDLICVTEKGEVIICCDEINIALNADDLSRLMLMAITVGKKNRPLAISMFSAGITTLREFKNDFTKRITALYNANKNP